MLRAAGADVLLFVAVKPNRPKSAFLGAKTAPGRAPGETMTELEVALAAPPVDGAANTELIAFCAKKLGLAKRSVELEAGAASRHKVLRLRGVQLGDVRAALEAAGVRVDPPTP